MMRIIRVKNASEVIVEFQGEQIPVDGFYDIPPDEFSSWSVDNEVIKGLVSGSIILNNGEEDILDELQAILYLIGNGSESGGLPKSVIANNRIKFSVAPDTHKADHQSGGSDEVNVDNLSGLLKDKQHPITQECKDAMGIKSNNNSFNHDRFDQSEINNLHESKLNLKFPTHDNSNDISANQKQALDNSNSPSASNPFLTLSDGIAGPQGVQGIQGDQGIQGAQGDQGSQGVQGDEGLKGDQGSPFLISAVYISVSAMNNDILNIVEGKFILINTGNVNDTDNGKLYSKTNGLIVFITDLSGTDGVQGPQGTQGLQGSQGIKGDTGSQGEQGTQGTQGTQGIQGLQGTQGPQGPIGNSLKRQFYAYIKRGGDNAIYDGEQFYSGEARKKTINWGGIRSDSYGQIMIPMDCILKEIVIKFRGAYWDNSAPSGKIRMGLKIYDHSNYDANHLGDVLFKLGDSYKESFYDDDSKKMTQKKSETLFFSYGKNSFSAGDLLGFEYKNPKELDGDVWKILNAHITLVFEEN